jgi:UDP-N-acetylglucosamine 1-carboxyvinyltransferase
MSKFVIEGGHPIAGTHTVAGNKNAALPMLAATVLTDEPVTFTHIPLIEDVLTMLQILEQLGCDVLLRGHTVTICAAGLKTTTLDPVLCGRARSSILFAGPLAARHGKAQISPPGGDVIGRRRLDTHFSGLRALGMRAEEKAPFRFTRGRAFRGANILLDEASVTATENIVMAAVLAPGETTIYNAACEPHVQDLCEMLNSMGARIYSIGTNLLRIRGVSKLGGCRCRIAPDYIEAVSYVAAAALTGGQLELLNAPTKHLVVIERTLQKLGIGWETLGDDRILVPADQSREMVDDIGAAIPKIEDGTWPNFPSDLMSVAIVLATQSRGSILFFEKMFESRLYFVDRLIDMGARIVQCDPHRVVVTGSCKLHASRVASPDIRAGMSMLLAALCADGTSTVSNAAIIDRGYERTERELRRLGAKIRRVEG